MKIDRKMHPRPQFIRENWQLLDGEWDFSFDDEDKGIGDLWFSGFSSDKKIKVPYTYESQMSQVDDPSHHNIVWYQRTIELEKNKKYTLNFEGVDYFCQVWLNGYLIGSHQGGYDRFSFDLDYYAKEGTNQIVLRVADSLSCEQPRGKQRWLKDNFGCWYVQTTGVWKSVWLEERLSKQGIESVKMTPDIDQDKIIFEPRFKNVEASVLAETMYLEIKILFAGSVINEYKGTITHEMTSIALDTRVKEDSCWGTKIWSPETPNLYDVEFRLYDKNNHLLDEVTSYFGMRKISIENGQILLNNEVLYQRLILDQGYWKESGITPPSVAALEKDVDRILALGYNGLRKHQKVEDERFMYLCDTKGLLVWVEMPSTYTFNDIAAENLTNQWLQIVKQHYNHPCVITWVPFNESWGIKGIRNLSKPQQFTEGIYHLTKAFDSNRPVITNDGWEHTISDILTLHDYEELGSVLAQRYADKEKIVSDRIMFNNSRFAYAENYSYHNQPIIISEFGGIAFSTEEEGNWGYGRQVKDEEEFMARFDSIHQSIQDLDYVCGYCYTQLTDVEQEVNGLLDTQREPKVDMKIVKKINERRTK